MASLIYFLLVVFCWTVLATKGNDVCKSKTLSVPGYNRLFGIPDSLSIFPLDMNLTMDDGVMILAIPQTILTNHARTYFYYQLEDYYYDILNRLTTNYNYTYYIDVDQTHHTLKWICGLQEKNNSLTYGKKDFDHSLEKVYTPSSTPITSESLPHKIRILQPAIAPARILHMYSSFNFERLVPNHDVKYMTRMGFNMKVMDILPAAPPIKVMIHFCQDYNKTIKFGKDNYINISEVMDLADTNGTYHGFYALPNATTTTIDNITMRDLEVHKLSKDQMTIVMPQKTVANDLFDRLSIGKQSNILIDVLNDSYSRVEFYFDFDKLTQEFIHYICGSKNISDTRLNKEINFSIPNDCYNFKSFRLYNSQENRIVKLFGSSDKRFNIYEITDKRVLKRSLTSSQVKYFSTIFLAKRYPNKLLLNILCTRNGQIKNDRVLEDSEIIPYHTRLFDKEYFVYYPEMCDLINTPGIYNIMNDTSVDIHFRRTLDVPVFPKWSNNSIKKLDSLNMIYKSNLTSTLTLERASVVLFDQATRDSMAFALKGLLQCELILQQNITIKLLYRLDTCVLTMMQLNGSSYQQTLTSFAKHTITQTKCGIFVQEGNKSPEFYTGQALIDIECELDSEYSKVFDVAPKHPTLQIFRSLKKC